MTSPMRNSSSCALNASTSGDDADRSSATQTAAARTARVPAPIDCDGRRTRSAKKPRTCLRTKGRLRIASNVGRCDGCVASIAPTKSERCFEYLEETGGYLPRTILQASPFNEFASKAWFNVAHS